MGVVVPTEANRACEENLKGCPALHTLFQHGLSERPSVGQISANMQSVQRENFWKDLPTELGIAFPSSQTADQALALTQRRSGAGGRGMPRNYGRIQYSIQYLAHLTHGTLGLSIQIS